jgi:ubiquinone/menaquinone biosynthesis C-methylase UbiE
MKTNNYDAVAGSYGFLSRLVFFKAQVNAQIEQLQYIPAGSSVLIVGGGTGWILEEIAKVHHAGLQIVYVELSDKMLDLAKKRSCGSNQVAFVRGDIEHYTYSHVFDVIHTAFLFDNFEESRATRVFQLLVNQLKVDGLWLYTDFKIEAGVGSGWKQALLRAMYGFFNTIAQVEAKKLPAMERLFSKSGCRVIARKQYYKGFIESIIFHKSQKLPTFMENLES